ncbi:hypothetical protein DPMN_135724 [Dreissena polymorpha]|uniref:Uncharacterized protein n=1 Tax=Dreissena polymorpha TaxID=45954 RepID=A0A9D4FYJ7_DREPO|nr:hypothetical protein DPMN_135724 [Dreissena polymorpha]
MNYFKLNIDSRKSLTCSSVTIKEYYKQSPKDRDVGQWRSRSGSSPLRKTRSAIASGI